MTSRPFRRRFLRTVQLLWQKRILVATDVLVLAFAFYAAYLLRYDFTIPRQEMRSFWTQLIFVTALQTLALIASGAQTFIWRFFGLADLRAFVYAALVASSPVVVMRFGLSTEMHEWQVPLSVTFIDMVFGFAGVVAARVIRRVIYERFQCAPEGASSNRSRRVLLIGAGRAGRAVVSEVRASREDVLTIKGFVDDDPKKKQMVIYGVKVLGTTEDIPWLVREHEIDQVVITMVQASRGELRRIKEICDQVSVKVQIVPSLWELIHNRVGVSRIRDFDIGDLLGREPVTLLDTRVRDVLQGKVVMVTGAGGSIGAELVRQVAHCAPSNLLLLDRAEPALFNIHFEMRRQHPGVCATPLLADITSRVRLAAIFEQYHPDVILHAAAHKHVPILENHVCEGVHNNIIGTQVLGELAGEYGAEVMVLISTDKAVRPKSVLGATKRVAEMVIQELDHQYACRYLAVRFGNVIGSAGSVIPVFREQIRNGGPVTVTDPEMVRYFMTIPEAAQLVLEAMTMGQGSEIFVLDMGEPVKILSLAKDVITLCGLKPYEDIDIVFTGIRPGEKLSEELEIEHETLSRTRHPKILIGTIAHTRGARLSEGIAEMKRLALAGDASALWDWLSDLVPEAALQPQASSVIPRERAASASQGYGTSA